MNRAPGCMALVFFAVVLLLPFFLANAMLTALARLGLTPGLSVAAALGIFLGGTVNIPVKRIPREEVVKIPPAVLFGIGRFLPREVRRTTHTTIAVNLGGCLIPLALVFYELHLLAGQGWGMVGLALLAAAANVVVCWWVARPIPEVGIAMPALVPALTAALSALIVAPEMAPPVAFVAGVLGPLVGADLLHWSDVKELATGVASIGGAGTFDGIVLSGLVATLLA